jgi:hypothetical protein
MASRFDERGWERCRMVQATAPILDSTEATDRGSATSRQILGSTAWTLHLYLAPSLKKAS